MENRLRKLIASIIREMTCTGDIAGYETPFAFSEKGKKNKKIDDLLKGKSLEGHTIVEET